MRAFRSLIVHDIKMFLAQPAYILAVLLPPLLFLLVEFAASQAIQYSPVALVTIDQGPAGQQMKQILHNGEEFRIYDATPHSAEILFAQSRVAAIITIPAGFSQRVQQKQTAPLDVRINNLNTDFADDVRRAVPAAIAQFYAVQANNPMLVHMHEHDLRSRDIELFQYAALPMLLLVLLIAGIVEVSSSTGKEWETHTIKELLLAPISLPVRLLGKIVAGTLIAVSVGITSLLFFTVIGLLHPQNDMWGAILWIILLVSFFGASLGLAIGLLLRQIQAAHSVAMNLSIYLFLLSGGVSVLAFEPEWVQALAAWNPLTYGTHALQMLVFYHSFDQFSRDWFFLFICCCLALILAWGAQQLRLE